MSVALKRRGNKMKYCVTIFIILKNNSGWFSASLKDVLLNPGVKSNMLGNLNFSGDSSAIASLATPSVNDSPDWMLWKTSEMHIRYPGQMGEIKRRPKKRGGGS